MYASCQSKPLLQQKHQSSRFRHEGAAEDNYLDADDDDANDDADDDANDNDAGDDAGDDADDDFILNPISGQ